MLYINYPNICNSTLQASLVSIHQPIHLPAAAADLINFTSNPAHHTRILPVVIAPIPIRKTRTIACAAHSLGISKGEQAAQQHANYADETFALSAVLPAVIAVPAVIECYLIYRASARVYCAVYCQFWRFASFQR